MKIIKLLFALVGFLNVSAGFASSRCDVPGSPVTEHWDAQLCEVQPLTPQTRCFLDPMAASTFRTMCSKGTAGCEQIPGGCIGSLEPGHWTVVWILENGAIVQKRCVCGCFGEETQFSLAGGSISGKELIARKNSLENSSFSLLTSTGFDGEAFTSNPITQIVSGPEKELAYKIFTEAGRVITLSSKHPVYVATKDGKLSEVRKAEALEVGLLLSAIDGSVDAIERIEKVSYKGEMVNFTVVSNDNASHFVFANELKMGDNAWQQYLSQREARILSRNDILQSLLNNAK